MGSPVIITPDQPQSSQVIITPDADQPSGAGSRFWAGVKHGMGDNSDVPPSHGTWRHPDFADNPMLPGSGVYRDIKAGNYAGAAGRVLGPAAVLGTAFLGGRGAAAEESPASVLSNRVVTERAMAQRPPFPKLSEGLPEVEAMRPQAEARLQQVTAQSRSNAAPWNSRQGTTEPQAVTVGKLPVERGDPYAGPRTPEMQRLDSTNLQKAGYHADSQTMVVEFRSGRVYEYRGVPKEIYNQFLDSESQGSFLARNIKGRYATNYRGSVLGRKY